MNAKLLEECKQICLTYDPNEIAFAIATTYNEMSRDRLTTQGNCKTYSKIATQYARINGHFLSDQEVYNDDTGKMQPAIVPGRLPKSG